MGLRVIENDLGAFDPSDGHFAIEVYSKLTPSSHFIFCFLFYSWSPILLLFLSICYLMTKRGAIIRAQAGPTKEAQKPSTDQKALTNAFCTSYGVPCSLISIPDGMHGTLRSAIWILEACHPSIITATKI